MATTNNQSKTLLYVSLGFFAIPVLIWGLELLRFDPSGFLIAGLSLFLGLPSIVAGTVLAIVSFYLSRKESANNPSVIESKSTKIIKDILITVIIVALSLPLINILGSIIWFFFFQ